MYEGKVIHIFYDAEHNTYCDNGVSNGINIKVIRDKNDNIEKLVEWCATRQVDKLNNENFFFPGTVYVPGCLCNVF